MKLEKNIVQKFFDSEDSCYTFDERTNKYGTLDGYAGYDSSLIICIGSLFAMYKEGGFYDGFYLFTSKNRFESNQELQQELQILTERKRMANNCCRFCGGYFKGIFSKVCSQCGTPKDY